MRTWKQGVVGKLSINGSIDIYVKCLKYPLALFFRKYSSETKEHEFELFYAFLDLSVLKNIDKLDELKLTVKERKISELFSIDFQSNVIKINDDISREIAINVIQNELLNIEDVKNIIRRLEIK